MPSIYLIDGFAQMFRAYYALPPGMKSPVTGEPTNASFGFAAMLLRLLETRRPDFLAMAIEGEGPTFRDALFPAYKSHRSPPPDDLVKQIPVMIELARLFGLPVLKVDGFEADDVLATLAVRLSRERPDDAVFLVAKDKDLDQVLSERVRLFDAHKEQVIGPAELFEKKGIRPDQARDYQALIGDPTDFVPGVPGIGPKTAATLLQKFGHLAGIKAGTGELKGKQKESLEKAIADGTLDMSEKLVTLATDVPVVFEPAAAAVNDRRPAGIQADALRARFKELGFTRLQSDLDRLLGASAPSVAASAPAAKAKPKAEPAAFGLFAGLAPAEPAAETAAALPPPTGNYRALVTRAEVEAAIADIRAAVHGDHGWLSVDTETTGLGMGAAIAGLCLAWKEGEGVYVPFRSPAPEAHLSPKELVALLAPLLADGQVRKTGHHLKFDLHILETAGLPVGGVAFDTMVAAHLLGEPGLGLKPLSVRHLGVEPTEIEALIGPPPRRKGDPPQKRMDEVPLAAAAPYGAQDADLTLRLTHLFERRLDEAGMTPLAREVEMPLISVLMRMERAGIRVDRASLADQRTELEAQCVRLKSALLEAAGVDFNPDSPKQAAEVLFDTLGFKSGKKTETGRSTDAEVLEKLAAGQGAEGVADRARAVPQLLLDYRELRKLVGTYLVALDEAIEADGRVRCRFHQTGAATGRLSASDPNLQNIPIRTETGRRIRGAFRAEDGNRLVAADYSQIELRMLAHLSGDPALRAAFAAGEDIHAAVAAEVFGVPVAAVTKEQRSQAKTVNFGIIYGVTAWGLARQVPGLSQQAAGALIADYKAKFQGIDRFMARCVEEAKTQGFVTTLLGRRRMIEGLHDRNPSVRALGERLAINSVVQGSAADLIKKAMVELDRRLAAEFPHSRMLLQIHDELVLEAPQAEAEAVGRLVKATMEGALALEVPLQADVGVGGNWLEAK